MCCQSVPSSGVWEERWGKEVTYAEGLLCVQLEQMDLKSQFSPLLAM